MILVDAVLVLPVTGGAGGAGAGGVGWEICLSRTSPLSPLSWQSGRARQQTEHNTTLLRIWKLRVAKTLRAFHRREQLLSPQGSQSKYSVVIYT